MFTILSIESKYEYSANLKNLKIYMRSHLIKFIYILYNAHYCIHTL